MAEHLAGCAPCRGEAAAMQEVDRRLQELGAYRRLAAGTLLVRLDQELDRALDAPQQPKAPADREAREAAWRLVLMVLAVLCIA